MGWEIEKGVGEGAAKDRVPGWDVCTYIRSIYIYRGYHPHTLDSPLNTLYIK